MQYDQPLGADIPVWIKDLRSPRPKYIRLDHGARPASGPVKSPGFGRWRVGDLRYARDSERTDRWPIRLDVRW
jgi:hypothetical protein